MLTPQFLLPVHNELVVDLFAGGGGASTGIEQAIGRPVDISINHDPEAVALHAVNHPQTQHYTSDVFEINPLVATRGMPVGLLWASPDCKHFSKAKGGKPVSKRIRGLAWVVVKWAKAVRPRVIILENVEEFQTWGPLTDDGMPCPKRKGETFEMWQAQLRGLGYRIEHRELRACDYGTPTIRKRFFMVARCDGLPIKWPEQTHFQRPAKGQQPWRTAAEIIDWSIPCPSIFERSRPLADATCRRIAKGIMRYVVDAADPFIVGLAHGDHSSRSGRREYGIHEPLRTIHAGGGNHALVMPTLVQTGYGERPGQSPRVPGLDKPLGTIVGTQKHALVAAFLAKHYTGVVGSDLRDPIGTVTSVDHHSLVTANLKIHAYDEGNDECNSSSSGNDGQRDLEDQQQRRDLEVGCLDQSRRQKAHHSQTGGMQDEKRLSGSQGVPAEQAISSISASRSLDNFTRTNPSIDGHQSHRRKQAEQRSIQSGDCHSKPKPEACGEYRIAGLHMHGSKPQAASNQTSGGRVELQPNRQKDRGFPHNSVPSSERVIAFITKYYGNEQDGVSLREPLHTIPTRDRFGLVTVHGVDYQIVDIGLRMLTPRELYRAQGFPDSYIIDRTADGRPITKTAQVRMCGNSVCPPLAQAIVAANYREQQEMRKSA